MAEHHEDVTIRDADDPVTVDRRQQRSPDEARETTDIDGPGSEEVDAVLENDLPEAPKSQDVATLVDLLRYAYAREGQRVATAAITSEVAAHLDLDDDARRELRARARLDVLLQVPWQIIAAVLRAEADQRLVDRLIHIITIAIQEHPVISVARERAGTVPGRSASDMGPADRARGVPESVLTVHRSLSACRRDIHELDPDSARAAVIAAASVPASFIEERLAEHAELTPRDLTEFKTNLVNTLAVLFATHQGWPPSVVAELLCENLWKPQGRDASDGPLVLLTDNPDPEVLAQVVDLWEERVDQAETRAAEAQRDAERMDRHASRLQDHVDALENERLDLKSEIDRLKEVRSDLEARLEERERRLGETRAHASHDYETLRTASIQRANRELELLQQGLHALTREKVHVTRDRLERAIEGLERELSELRGDEPR